MKLCIAGSRNFKLKPKVISQFLKIFEINTELITEVVSGKEASGIDKCGEEWAREHNIPIKPFPYMKEFGRAGGHIRNGYMAEYCDIAIIFRNNNSPGSTNMINQMDRVLKPYYVVNFKDKVFFDFKIVLGKVENVISGL